MRLYYWVRWKVASLKFKFHSWNFKRKYGMTLEESELYLGKNVKLNECEKEF